MEKKKSRNRKKNIRKTKKLFITVSLTALVFVVATYAWFVGISQANVTNFSLDIKAAEGLLLSIDGENYSTELDLSSKSIISDAYESNTNSMGGEKGLSPISTVGELDQTGSVLKLFSKTSMNSNKGGYRLIAGKIENFTTGDRDVVTVNEQDGYVAFDLFIKNSSDADYTPTYDLASDEGVYLSEDSSVSLSVNAGETVDGDGLQNSVRVAFMQIGRVSASASSSDATGITCSDGTSLSLCNRATGGGNGLGQTWNIWEPNDTAHEQKSVTHFSNVCKKRTDANTYGDACTSFSVSDYVNTFAINSEILVDDNLNIYDGLNDYSNVSSKIQQFDYFTDSEKNADPDDKKELFFLAPNSVTKVRVYIYMEGQDVDNYDVTVVNRKINVSFGFTKDKFNINAAE